MDEIKIQAKLLNLAEENYEIAFNDLLRKSNELEMDRFWQLTEKLRNLIEDRIDHDDTSKLACDEFMRLALTKEEDYTLEEALGFVKTYDKVVSFMSNRAESMSENGVEFNRSDDSFSDLIDNLPLLGPKFYKKFTGGKYKNFAKIEDDISKLISRELFYFIVNGENYISMFLRDSLREKLRYH